MEEEGEAMNERDVTKENRDRRVVPCSNERRASDSIKTRRGS